MTRRVRFFATALAICALAYPGILSAQESRAGQVVRLKAANQMKVRAEYGKLPLAFEANQGQTDGQVKFLSRGAGYTLFLTGGGAALDMMKESRQSLVVSRQLNQRRRSMLSGNGRRPTNHGRQPTTDSVLAIQLDGANPNAPVAGEDELPGKSNYFIGNDPKGWRTDVANYAKVRYTDVYPGIDLVYYGNQVGRLEYDFVVAPGADPGAIKLDVGAVRLLRRAHRDAPLRIAQNGDLVVNLDGGEVRFNKPVIYQPDGDSSAAGSSLVTRHSSLVNGRYRLRHHQVTFEFAKYDRTRPLVIDPALSYSSYLGGSNYDAAYGIVVDASGNLYVTGDTYSTDFPVTAGVFQPTLGGNEDAFVTKINPAGSALVYSTYLGGSGNDAGSGIAVDSSGNAYVTGGTGSSNFPTTPGAFETSCGSNNCGTDASFAFVTKLNPSGSALVYSTYLGGTGNYISAGANAIAVDATGDAYVAGGTEESNFPTTAGVFQPTCHGACQNAFISKFNSTGSALVYSSYVGGEDLDYALGIALDSSGNAYLAGSTDSPDFPVTEGAFQRTYGGTGGDGDGFVTKVNPTGTALVYSTYLGGTSDDSVMGIAIDTSGEAYVSGYTRSSNFPITAGAFETTCSACGGEFPDGFVTKLNSSGSALVYSTFLGGSAGADVSSIALDSSGDAYVTGSTWSEDFPVTPAAFQTTDPLTGGDSGFVTELNPAGSGVLYSSYLGGNADSWGNGIALDSSRDIYVTGQTEATNFPVTPGAFQTGCGGGCLAYDAFVTKFGPGDQIWPLSLNFANQTVGIASAPQTATLSNSGTTALSISSLVISVNNGTTSQTNTCGNSLAAGATCTISISWVPSAAGSMSGSITVTDSAANSPQTVSLTGTGVEPVATLSPTSLTFPTQLVFTMGKSQAVTLTNTGLGTLTISSFGVTGEFGQTNTCGASLAPGVSCTINVSFLPRTRGLRTGTVTITDNAPGSPQTVSLTGMCTYIELSPTSINFGSQPVGTTSLPRKIAVTNKGDASVDITAISIGGSDPGDFAETNTCGPSLASGASCFVTVTFTPSAKGKRSASVSIYDNGGGNPQTASLSGTGT